MIDAIQKMVAEQTEANVKAAEQEWQKALQSLPGAAGFGGSGSQSAAHQFRN